MPYTPVRASRGKLVRAEPIAALYEQEKVSHVGMFKELEDQLCSYAANSAKSPDRLDALVWALTELSRLAGLQYGEVNGIKDFFTFLQPKAPETKEAPQVYLNVNAASHYRRDNYDAYAERRYRKNAIVYRCINEIANGAACIPFKLFQGDDELVQHPLLSLLRRPNPTHKQESSIFVVYSYLLVGHNNYSIKSDVNGDVRELYPLRPDRVKTNQQDFHTRSLSIRIRRQNNQNL